jgi:hypothetical protein
MNEVGRAICECLLEVEVERCKRKSDPALSARVDAIKAFQHRRFARTYSDLLSSPKYDKAARFFLDELYGPYDFAERDRQFERVVPGLVRIFSDDIVATVHALAELHCISERLDTRMGVAVAEPAFDESAYCRAWRHVGERELRSRQIDLTLDVGRALDRYTKRPLLRHSLRALRGPAQLAGVATLQRFLELGFDTFREMPDPSYFLDIVERRERHLAATLFGGSCTTHITWP